MNKAIKRMLAVALGSALTIGTIIVPPQSAQAADNKAVFSPVHFDGKNWQSSNDHWKSQEEFSLLYDASKDTPSQLSTDYTISYKMYFPTSLIKHMNSKGEEYPYINIGNSVSMWNANGEGGDDNYLGRLDASDITFWYDTKAKTPFLDEGADFYPYAKLNKDGDYYVLTVTDLPTNKKMWNDDTEAYDKDVDTSVSGFESVGIVLNANNFKDNSFVALDDIQLKKNGNVVLSENFGGDNPGTLDLYCGAINENDDTTLTAAPFTNKIVSVDKTKVSVKKGKKATLKVTVPSVAGKIKYKTSNKKVATVSSKGVIKGIKKGKATVTVTAAGVSKKVTVNVK